MDRNLGLPNPHSPQAERRHNIRQKLHSPVYVSFNRTQSGMVVDLSELLDLHEHGFAVQTAIPSGIQTKDRLEVNSAVTLCLELPETKKYLHGSGQVMWTDRTGRAGIRFSFLPDASRQILKEWLFANLLVASTNHAARTEQIAQRRQEESIPLGSSAPLEPLSSGSLSENNLKPKPAVRTSTRVGAAALLDRVELLLALDDVRQEVRNIESRPIEDRDLAADAEAILHIITDRALRLTGASGAALALLSNDERMLCRARAGNPAPPLESEVNVREGLSGECIRSATLVASEDLGSDPRVDPQVFRTVGIASLIAAPILSNSRVVGILEVFSPRPRSFTKLHETIMERLVELVPAIEQTTLEKENVKPQAAQAPVEAIVEAIDEKESEVANPEDEIAVSLPAEQKKTEDAGKDIEQEIEQEIKLAIEKQIDLEKKASARSPHLPHIALFGLALGTIALVLGYVLAPTIEKRWGATQAAQSLERSSAQSSAKSELASSGSLQNTSDRRGAASSSEDLRKLADQGDSEAAYQLGILYHEGSVFPKDDSKAVQWFQRAAEQGYVRAQSTLGAYYWAGRGVPQDFSKAYFWSQLALAQGDENSKSRLEGLSAQMTQSQVANARQQAEAWLHAHNQAMNSKPN